MLALALGAPAGFAQIIADPSAPNRQRPTVLESANGTPTVNIQTKILHRDKTAKSFCDIFYFKQRHLVFSLFSSFFAGEPFCMDTLDQTGYPARQEHNTQDQEGTVDNQGSTATFSGEKTAN